MAEPSRGGWGEREEDPRAVAVIAALNARVAELERERDSRLDEELDVIGQLPQKNERIATLERDLSAAREDAEKWKGAGKLVLESAHAACDSLRKERDAALAKVEAMREALRGLADEIMWDKTLCFCGPNHGPAPHGKDCLDARAALALCATPDAPHP